MATEIPTKEPSAFTAGDTVKWKRANLSGDYPATGGWTLKYYLYGPEGVQAVDAVADGVNFAVTITALVSSAFVAGDYAIKGFVTKTATSERYLVYENSLTVNPDPANINDATETRSHAKKCLDAIEAVLEGRATRSDRSYTIAGRQTEHYTFEDLMKLRDYYAGKVAAEKQAAAFARGEGGGQVLVRFSRPS